MKNSTTQRALMVCLCAGSACSALAINHQPDNAANSTDWAFVFDESVVSMKISADVRKSVFKKGATG